MQLLIDAQTMGYKATATMEDLESAIKEDVDIDLENEVGSDTSRSQSIEEDTVNSAAKESVILPEKQIFGPKRKRSSYLKMDSTSHRWIVFRTTKFG